MKIWHQFINRTVFKRAQGGFSPYSGRVLSGLTVDHLLGVILALASAIGAVLASVMGIFWVFMATLLGFATQTIGLPLWLLAPWGVVLVLTGLRRILSVIAAAQDHDKIVIPSRVQTRDVLYKVAEANPAEAHRFDASEPLCAACYGPLTLYPPQTWEFATFYRCLNGKCTAPARISQRENSMFQSIAASTVRADWNQAMAAGKVARLDPTRTQRVHAAP